jgi:hypothetical protein
MTERQRQFIDMYKRHRIQDQLNYYEARQREFEAAQFQGSWIAGVIMIAASAAAFGAFAARPHLPIWTVLAAALPALSAAVASFQRLYAFERLAKLYADASTALDAAGSVGGGRTDKELEASIQAFVAKAERIFQQEQGQWGQLTADLHVEELDATKNANAHAERH